MATNLYLLEKAREVHTQDLRRELMERQLLAHLPRDHRSRSRHTAGKRCPAGEAVDQDVETVTRKKEVPFVKTGKEDTP